MTKVGGKFIDDFKSWRNKQITAPTDSSKLTVEEYLKLTTYDSNKVDIVKEKSDAMFIDIVNYHQSDLAIKAMGISKPSLSAEILALAAESKVKEFYAKYGQLWLLKALQSSTETTTYKYKINIEQVNSDMNAITRNTMFTKQTMMLNFLALKEKAPQFLPFLYISNTLISKVKAHLLKQENLEQWVKDAAAHHVANKDVNTEYDQYRFNELKTKLDLLDPTFDLSNSVLGLYHCTLFAFVSNSNPKDTPLIRKIYEENILRELNKIEKNPNNEFRTLLGEMKAAYGGTLIKLTHKLSSSFFTFMNQNIQNTINPNHVMTLESILVMKEDSANALKLPSNQTFYKFGNALLVSCQLAALAYGFLNYNKLNGFQKGLLYTGTALTVVDISRAIAGKTIFTYMGNVVRDVLYYRGGTALAKGVAKALTIIPKFIGKSILAICNKLVPVLLIISIGISIWDAVVAAKEQNWGIFAVSIAEVVAAAGVGLCIIFATTAWAGPVSLILGGVLIALALIKVIWGFLSTLFEGDPRLDFINSCEGKYRNSQFIDFYFSYAEINGPIDTEEEKQKFITVYNWALGKHS
ncbi:hypothetical protein DLAC_05851 [Tieghemostelium lacteum]|uniref:Uncharacterized protein n=1 Tax=Tieghemostelium lacteum TaxID=361077 RepID=A0A151ZGW9_TIELA|nr:hypothetical protein DLAC_05851 [Tieghemostelium lacteum]|eukprot:KYQ93213.1 hypothetical protein DLAC_05851 [Tieghemostelium lacteum]